MKKIIISILCTILVVSTGFAQKRNLLTNADFEKTSMEMPEGWSLGNGVSIANQGIPINGNYSILVNGMEADENSVLKSEIIWTSNAGEVYEVQFKASAKGGTAKVKGFINQHKGTMHDLQLYNILGENNEAVVSGEEVREYKITGISFGGSSGKGHDTCDYTRFLLDFSSMASSNVELTLDDIRIIRIDNLGEAYANIYAGAEKVRKNGISDVIWFWKEHQAKEWQIKIVAESASDASAMLQVEGNWETEMEQIPVNFKKGLHTYNISLKPTILNNQELSGTPVYLTLDTKSAKVTILKTYMVEKSNLERLVIDMPDKLQVGQTVPVNISAYPTNADNQARLVCTSGGKLENVNGNWFYTQTSRNEVKITATSAVDENITTDLVINKAFTGIATNSVNEIKVLVDNQSQTICVSGLNGGEDIQLINTQGQVVAVYNNVFIIPVSHLSKGVYVLNITNGKILKTEKFVLR